MKFIYLMLIFFASTCSGCGLRERERELEKKENEVNQKEQRLLLLEKQLQLKEDALAQREKEIDTIKQQNVITDSAMINLSLVGKWSVNMRCTETTCEGSAVGDTKNEQWDIEYQNYVVIVKAMADNKLARVYTGAYTENGLQLTAEHEPEAPTTKITARLQQKNTKEMEGIREISRSDVCKIVYAVTMKKI
jgi:uncharacterized protein (DUF3084 family)